MHIKANMRNNICDVRSSEGEILNSIGEALVSGRVTYKIAITIELELYVDRGRTELAVQHASMLEDIQGALLLLGKEAIQATLNNNPQKMVKRTQILHGKLVLKTDDLVQEAQRRAIEHNVINIEEVQSVTVPPIDEQRCV